MLGRVLTESLHENSRNSSRHIGRSTALGKHSSTCYFRNSWPFLCHHGNHNILRDTWMKLMLTLRKWISYIIKVSTSDNAFLVFWLVHSTSVISSYTLVWPHVENNKITLGQSRKVDLAIFLPTKQQKNTENTIPAATKKPQILVWNYLMVLQSFLINLKKL